MKRPMLHGFRLNFRSTVYLMVCTQHLQRIGILHANSLW